MDNNFKQKIDQLITEVCTVNDLQIKLDILNYIEQQSSYMLWVLQDEAHINEDVQNY